MERRGHEKYNDDLFRSSRPGLQRSTSTERQLHIMNATAPQKVPFPCHTVLRCTPIESKTVMHVYHKSLLPGTEVIMGAVHDQHQTQHSTPMAPA